MLFAPDLQSGQVQPYQFLAKDADNLLQNNQSNNPSLTHGLH